jgi:hypothetical protein
MSRKEKRVARSGRLEVLLAAGAHGAAARAARAVRADDGADPEERARAGAVLASLSPDPLAVALGLLGAAGAVVLAGWLASGGAR